MTAETRQIEQHELKAMSPAQIDEARQAGRLARVLGVPEAEIALLDRATRERLTRDDLAQLNRLGRHDLVLEAFRDGRTPATPIEEEN